MRQIKTFIITILFAANAINGFAQIKVRNDNTVQIGYEEYSYLTFGQQQSSPNNGKYAIEYWNGGLNFWRPWPAWPAGNYILYLRDDHNVGIGTTGSHNYRLSVAGNARAYHWYTYSDKRLKTNIKTISNGLDLVAKINPVSFDYNIKNDKYAGLKTDNLTDVKKKTIENDTVAGTFTEKGHAGFLAQNIKEVLPAAVKEDENGYLAVDYDEIIPLLVQAIKELNEKVEKLQMQQNNNGTTKSGSIGELYQNTPNPFSQTTIIKYNVSNGNNIKIMIFNMEGTLQKVYDNLSNGQGNVKINARELQPGMYMYSLVVDGKIIDTKRMILTK